MSDVLVWLENSALSVFIREWPSILGFPSILFLHTLGLAMVAGASIAIDLWILQRPLLGPPLRIVGLNRTMWLGFGINLFSGVALLARLSGEGAHELGVLLEDGAGGVGRVDQRTNPSRAAADRRRSRRGRDRAAGSRVGRGLVDLMAGRDRDGPTAGVHLSGAVRERARVTLRELIVWLTSTPINTLVMDYRWTWPISESLHFCGLALMVGTVGTFDLRVLGLGKGLSPAALHRSIKVGLAGFAISAITGSLFIFGQPDQYFYNNAFKVKVTCLLLLGLNVCAFYALEARQVLVLGARRGRIVARERPWRPSR